MAARLKNRYDRRYLQGLAAALAAADPRIDADAFSAAVMSRGWNALELKQRMRRIAETLGAHVPGDYRQQLATLQRTAPGFGGFEAMFFPDFVEVFGGDDFDASVAALEHFTRYSSSEFAVRPFIVHYGADMMAVMRRWSEHPDEHVRRLASEGCRPRLPWGLRLTAFIDDPTPVVPILERLRADPSDDVRRSVANNLNDIAKDHPTLVLKLARRWIGESPATDALLKHACRTLLKRGHDGALRLFGHPPVEVDVRALRLDARRLRIGGTLGFSFTARLDASAAARLRVEYAIDFVKAAGHRSRKVFKIGERAAGPGETFTITRRHRLCDFTTRTHHPGRHRLTVIINGIERAAANFLLTRD